MRGKEKGRREEKGRGEGRGKGRGDGRCHRPDSRQIPAVHPK
jgi:hypothetical protein